MVNKRKDLLDRLNPQLILVSCGIGNRYEHPSHGPYVVKEDTLAILRTDRDGSVRLEWDDQDRMWISLWNRRPVGGSLDTVDRRF